MTAVSKKKATSTKATVKTASATLKVVDPAGNSGIPAPAPKGFDGRKIKLVALSKENRRLPNQAVVVLNTLKALGADKKPVTQAELIAAMLENGLKTVQTPKRIYTFYRKDLLEEGYIAYA